MSVFSADEGESAKYATTITDPLGVAPALSVLTLTLYDKASGDIINSRDGQDVLNTNGVTYNSTTGALVWTIAPEDNPIVDDALAHEEHVALFEGTYSSTKKLKHEVSILVRNLRMVP
jgi:hypothetical protein